MVNFFNKKVKSIFLVFCISLLFKITTKQTVIQSGTVKPWTIVVYMSAVNDLEYFSRRNIKQLMALGSNENVNFLVQLDTKIAGGKKITKRYIVQKDQLVITNSNQYGMDSGDPQTLIDCVRWAHNYPSQHFMLVLWNHGTGIIDVGKPKGLHTSDLFVFNPVTNLIELDRSLPFLECVNDASSSPRGICFDDATGNYLSNQKLEEALKIITKTILKKKIDVIGFDACLMSMLEIANIVSPYCHFMVGSQEVELGTGWDYQDAFTNIYSAPLTPSELVSSMVLSYKKSYMKITSDYTQSALRLDTIASLEYNVDHLAKCLITALSYQQTQSVQNAIKMSRHTELCTHFDEPSYIDLHHFYSNMLKNLHYFKFVKNTQTHELIPTLKHILQEGLELLKITIVNNVVGDNLVHAQGLSIYFPERFIHSSYKNTKFAKSNAWFSFLQTFLIH